MRGKTRLMQEAEKRVGMPLEVAIPQLYNQYGLVKAAEMMGVSHSTLWYWFMRFKVSITRKAISDTAKERVL